MKISIPKGSYHEYVRNKSYSKSSRSYRQKIRQVGDIQKGEINLKQFENFETYLLYLQHKDHPQQKNPKSLTERPYETSQTSRPRTHGLRRHENETRQQKQDQTLIKPYFPFFKCRIESTSSPSKDNQFRISNKKFRLKYRIIEENMGKGESKNYF